MTRLDYSQFDAKLCSYFEDNVLLATTPVNKGERHFLGTSNYGVSKDYKDWLFSLGAIAKLHERKWVLEFFSEQDAMMFTLKWSGHNESY